MTYVKRIISSPRLIFALAFFGILLYHVILFITHLTNYLLDNPVSLLFVIIALPFIIYRQRRKYREKGE